MADGPWLPPFFLGPDKQCGGGKQEGELVKKKCKFRESACQNMELLNVRGGHDSTWCGGGVQGFGGGSARGGGTLEYRTLGWVIPHQGGGQEELLVWTRKGGGALIKIYFKVVVIKCKPYRTGL